MRLVIQDKELEFRVQERRITVCSVFHKGKEIASDLAIHAPQDPYNQREGEKIAVERVAEILYQKQQEERKESMAKVDKVFTEIGALIGNVEFPLLERPVTIVQKVMAKLDARRERKALQGADKQSKPFIQANPSTLAGVPFFESRFLRPEQAVLVDRAFPFGISTKPRG